MAEIAVVGTACEYPGASSPQQLWENVCAGRQAFRRFPVERLDLEEYRADRVGEVDSTYLKYAAVLDGYRFDRERFRVSGRVVASADTAHWLALDVATRSIASAGFADPSELPRERTGVVVGNSLTGEFSRAASLRGRWPYVERAARTALAGRLPAAEVEAALAALATEYLAPFPEVDDETLAGALSNTIAGRICNHFDVHGGGYVVDGACASSLLAIATACGALESGDLDLAIAGGVDLSLDPLEMVGFSRLGAIAEDDMLVYDRDPRGFLPGEGAGFVTLMRLADAEAQGRPVLAVVRGWGVASDGAGGITRPSVDGQLLAVRRAYARAGFGPETVPYFEGHGTGTPVGDEVELETLARARGPESAPAVVGSVKTLIGHTKAAAGVAGFLKAVAALRAQVVPPATGLRHPHPLATGVVRAASEGGPWPADQPLRAGVSAMGFGGIDAHVVLEAPTVARRSRLDARHRRLLSSRQDRELVVAAAADAGSLASALDALARAGSRISRAELADLGAAQAASVDHDAAWRAALVVSSPDDLAEQAARVAASLRAGEETPLACRVPAAPPAVGFVFPGQASPSYPDGGLWRRRFAAVAALYRDAPSPEDSVRTDVAQPCIVRASLAGLAVLRSVGLEAEVALGHSLGELTALHWAGCTDAPGVLALAEARGRLMQAHGAPGGAMAVVCAGRAATEALLRGGVVVAGENAPDRTVVAGPAADVDAVVAAAARAGVEARQLTVSHAFHSPGMAPVVPHLAEFVAGLELDDPSGRMLSTVTGCPVVSGADAAAALVDQLTSPVLFWPAVAAVREEVGLWVEVGPGSGMTSLLRTAGLEAVAVDAGGASLGGLLTTVGRAWTLGCPVDVEALFADRFTRPFSLDREPVFLVNPCSPLAPRRGSDAPVVVAPVVTVAAVTPRSRALALLAARCDLPASSIRETDRLSEDLHLGSIAVAGLVQELLAAAGRPGAVLPTGFARATVGELLDRIEELSSVTAAAPAPRSAGVGPWVRPFRVEWLPAAPLSGEAVPVVRVSTPEEAVEALRRPGPLAVSVGGPGVAGLLKSAYLESPDRPVLLLHGEAEVAQVPPGFTEVGAGGERPALVPVPGGHAAQPALTGADTVLVTGGGKGITAECVIELAKTYGCSFVLVGRADPAADAELAANLERFAALGVRFRYERADVTRPVGLDLAGVTAVVHAAARNEPVAAAALTPADLDAARAVKVDGLASLLAALPSSPRLIVAFGSVIQVSGFPGAGAYAAANEALAAFVDDYAARHPGTRALTVAWSAWAGAGMAERLGSVELMAANGIAPIAIEDGVRALVDVLDDPSLSGTVVVVGRLGDLPTARFAPADRPLLRFVDRVEVDVPGVELVAATELTPARDPYLDDHVIDGVRVFPGVLGLEAIAQAAVALTGRDGVPDLVDVAFTRPVTVPDGGEPLRVAALADARGERVRVALGDAFTATCEWAGEPPAAVPPAAGRGVRLDGARLYDTLLFQRGRFARLARYEELSSTSCVAVLAAPGERVAWFDGFTSATLLLGDPGARDATLHAIQACVPDRRLLPVGVERLRVHDPAYAGARVVRARERSCDGDEFVYDVEVTSEDGAPVESWTGLVLRSAGPVGGWDEPELVAVVVERRLRSALGLEDLRLLLARGEVPTAELVGAEVAYEPGGRPWLPGGGAVSAARSGDWSVAVTSASGVTCDVERVEPRDWEALLGADRAAVARGLDEAYDVAATRVWCAYECLVKAGVPDPVLVAAGGGVFEAGGRRVATDTGIDGYVVGVLAPA